MPDYDFCEFCTTPVKVPKGYIHDEHVVYCSVQCYLGEKLFLAHFDDEQVRLRQAAFMNYPVFK